MPAFAAAISLFFTTLHSPTPGRWRIEIQFSFAPLVIAAAVAAEEPLMNPPANDTFPPTDRRADVMWNVAPLVKEAMGFDLEADRPPKSGPKLQRS